MSETTTTIQEIMAEKGEVTLKAIASVFGVPANRLYSVAKQPKEGEVYDAKVYNWEAIERFCMRRLDETKGYGTLEDVIALAIEADAQFKENDGRRARGTGAKVEMITVDGKEIPKRKYDSFEMANNNPVVLRGDDNVYKIVLQTESHTVLVPIKDMEGNVASQAVKVISNSMLNHKGVSPAALEDAIKERFEKADDDTDANAE